MKIICDVFYWFFQWLGWGPFTMIDGLIATFSLNFFHSKWGIKTVIWTWDVFRRPFLSK